jgi:hypothetical protein
MKIKSISLHHQQRDRTPSTLRSQIWSCGIKFMPFISIVLGDSFFMYNLERLSMWETAKKSYFADRHNLSGCIFVTAWSQHAFFVWSFFAGFGSKE